MLHFEFETTKRLAGFSIIILWALILPLSTSLAQDAAHFKYQHWEGGAYIAKTSNKFRHCAMTATYKSGTILVFAYLRDGLYIGIGNEKWSLHSNAKYKVVVSVDNIWNTTAQAVVRDNKSGENWIADIKIGHSTLAYESLRAGRSLTVKSPTQTLRYRLTGTYVALNKLRDCYDNQTMIANSDGNKDYKNPFSGGKSASTNPFLPSEKRNSPAKKNTLPADFAKLVIAYMDGEDVQILDKTPRAFEYLKPNLIWTTKHGIGMVTEAPVKINKSVLEKVLSAGDRKWCAGDFASNATSRELPNKKSVKVSVIKTACLKHKDNDLPFYVTYTFYPLNSGGMIRVAQIAYDHEDASAADIRFFKAADRIFEPKTNKHY